MIFIPNKYTRCYFAIINSAQRTPRTGYCEIHHIMPRSFGGSDDPSNLVRLSAREHFLCHMLLIKMTAGKEKSKMIFAANLMLRGKKRYTPKSSRIYQSLREQYSKHMSLISKGVKKGPRTDQHKRNLSKSLKGNIPYNKGGSTVLKGKSYIDVFGAEKAAALKEQRSLQRRGKLGRQNMSGANPNAKPIDINGKHYPSTKDACRELGLTYYAISKLLTN